MKKRHGVFFGFAVLLIAAIFTVTGCDPGGGDDDDPELAKWDGTWNPVHDYLDDPGLLSIFQAQYGPYEAMFSFDEFLAFVKAIAATDFGSFVVQGDKITFYDKNQSQKEPQGNVIETITYTFKGIRHEIWGPGEEVDMYTFEGDKAGAHKYLLFEEAERDTQDGPLHFHMRYGSKSFDDLLISVGDNYNRWYPTIVSYDTTIAELQVFMSGD
jgi:Zn/Cd-binding protein ZinT